MINQFEDFVMRRRYPFQLGVVNNAYVCDSCGDSAGGFSNYGDTINTTPQNYWKSAIDMKIFKV